jgi:hypothetical protein
MVRDLPRPLATFFAAENSGDAVGDRISSLEIR